MLAAMDPQGMVEVEVQYRDAVLMLEAHYPNLQPQRGTFVDGTLGPEEVVAVTPFALVVRTREAVRISRDPSRKLQAVERPWDWPWSAPPRAPAERGI